MKPADLVFLSLICFVWGLNIVVTRWIVVDAGIPPLAFACLRFLVLAVVLLPFLLPRPSDMARMFLIAMGMGAAHFGLMFMGLLTSSAGSVAVISQLGVPFSTLLSVLLLGETIRWRRTLGIILSFVGVAIMVWQPDALDASNGALLVALSAFVGAVATILMKRIEPMPVLQMQSWVALFSAPPLIAFSWYFETGQIEAIANGGWPLIAAILFAVLIVSIFGHGGFYALLKRYDVTLLLPLTLMTPLWGMVLGIVLLDEPLGLQQCLGSLVALAGVGIIAMRPNSRLAALGRKLFS